jgi:uncharacterized protein (TIGR00255 family)
MIRSMTGFGEAEVESPAGRLHAEIRTVNHRFFSANVRVPGGLDRHDPDIREWLRALLPRGHVNCAIRVENGSGPAGPVLRLNEERARQYQRVLAEMKERLGLAGDVDVGLMSRIGGIIEEAEPELVEVPAEALRTVTERAATAVIEMRRIEGERLRSDLEARLAAVESSMAVVRRQAPLRLQAERDRLRQAVVELAGDVAVDEERLAREIAFLAERWDIGEELVRLASHIALFREIVDASDDEPAGKRLGFLVQEMHREANTMGAKANDAAIEHEVVAIKNEIERLREQVDNVE